LLAADVAKEFFGLVVAEATGLGLPAARNRRDLLSALFVT
jgi:hypothetical protein